MKIVFQRVKNASLKINGTLISQIDNGIVAYVGFSQSDNETCLDYMVNKLSGIRIFNDENGKINLPNSGEFLIVPNFTLFAETSHGFRPSFINAQSPEIAKDLFNKFVKKLEDKNPNKIKTGVFGADMEITQTNDGPITIILEN